MEESGGVVGEMDEGLMSQSVNVNAVKKHFTVKTSLHSIPNLHIPHSSHPRPLSAERKR